MRGFRRGVAGAALLAGFTTLALAKPVIVRTPPRPRRVTVAAVDVLEGRVDLADASRRWHRLNVKDRLATGERVRTAADATALVRLPWMTLLMAPATELGISNPGVLSTSLESGRLEQRGERGIVKLDAGSVRIRGRGHLVVRRLEAVTAVSVFEGAFSVESPAGILQLARGTGAVAGGPERPRAERLLAPPTSLRPGADPEYVVKGQALSLSWTPADRPAHVQIYSLDERPLLVRDVEGSPLRVDATELGTYRWRVTLREPRGLESEPSAFGAYAVVDK